VRLLWGDADDFLPPDRVAKPLAQELGAELRLLPGGHFLPHENPDAVAREILAYA
jgi:pimeloyl-ACP methyl ester carboxylesterase